VQLEKLVCPVSGSKLEIIVFKNYSDGQVHEYVETGVLYSVNSNFYYPIINGVPILLAFETPLVKKFEKEHYEKLKLMPKNITLPNLEPMKGEKSIQMTFTEEWEGLGDDEVVFAYDEEEGYLLHKDVWLQMSDEECDCVESVLDVGCGFGKEAHYLSRIFSKSTVYAIDLNLAVVASGMQLLLTGKIIPVVASLFRLPFKDNSFDHVHCQGVAHHTFSTKKAFDSIEKKVSENGSFFLWVYAWEDSFGVSGVRGVLVHTYYFVSHRIFRPVLSRLPGFIRNPIVHFISIFYHPLVKDRGSNKGRWKYTNTVHAIRDMFTPMYAHRHRHNEVLFWFQNLGYLNLKMQSAFEYQKLFHRKIIGIGFNGSKKTWSR
jgi:SAM-dependent methyltransferase/uncharacterized protein YbaR (Trm112 family)